MEENHSAPVQQSKDEYATFFESLLSQPLESHIQYIQKLVQGSATTYLDKVCPEIKITNISYSLNLKVLVMRVRLNQFQFQVSIINEEVDSRAHLLEKRQYKYADIYSTTGGKTDFVVKCFRMQPQRDAMEQFCLVLREYCYSRIAAQLQIGPELVKSFGFDLQVTEECIQFSMLKYKSIENAKQFFNSSPEEHQGKIKQKLFQLHLLKITHNNIHPFNLLYNPNSNQFVLSDFCFCRYLPSAVGTKTKTKFSGALNYSHSQMLEVFDGRASEADLYLNDVHCLNESFSYLRKSWGMQQRLKAQGKRYRVQQMRDVYDDYGAYFSNMGSFYKRIDEAYDYLFSYYNLLQMFMSIHQRKDVLGQKSFIDAMGRFPEYALSITEEYSPSHYLSQIREKICQHLSPQTRKTMCWKAPQPAEKETQNLFQRQLLGLRRQMIQDIDGLDQIYSLDALEEMMAGLFDFEGGKHVREVKIQRKVIVHNPAIIVRLGRDAYFREYLRFIEIRQTRSTYDQKIKASNYFLKALKIELKTVQTAKTEHPQLQKCLKHTLYYFLENPDQGFEYLIPDILTNLIILDSISEIDLFSILQRAAVSNIDLTKKALILFNIYCGVDWIKFKSVNLFQHRKIFQTSRKRLLLALKDISSQDTEDQTHQSVVRLIVGIMTSDTKALQITPEIKTGMVGQLKGLVKRGIVNELTANRMAALICLNSAIDSEFYFSEGSILKAISEIYDFNPKLAEDRRLQSFHLRIYAMLEHIKSDDIQLCSIKNRFWMTLQVPKLLNKFKLFFSEERSRFNNKEIPPLVKTIQSLSAVQKYKFCQDIILEWQHWLEWLLQNKEQQLYEYYLQKLRKLYTTDALYNMDFPSISPEQDFLAFYEHTFELTSFYCIIYRNQEREAANIAANFLDQLQSHHDALNFEGSRQIKMVAVHFLKLIKSGQCFLERRASDALKVWKQGVRQLLCCADLPQTCMRVYLLQYIETLFKWGYFLKTNKNRERAARIIFRFLKNRQLIPCLLDHHRCDYFLLFFVNHHTLIELTSIDFFLEIHQILFSTIDRHPQPHSIRIYTNALTDFMEKSKVFEGKDNQEMVDSLTNILMSERIKLSNHHPAMSEEPEYVKLNRYSCMLLSCMFRYQKEGDAIIHDMTRRIARDIGSLCPLAQTFILDQMFTFRLIKGIRNLQFIRRGCFETRNFARYILDRKARQAMQKKQAEVNKLKKKKQRYEKEFSLLEKLNKRWLGCLQEDSESQDDNDI